MRKIIFLFLILMLVGCTNQKKLTNEETKALENFLNTTNTAKTLINSYTIYGRFFNLEGEINENLDNLELVLKNSQEELTFEVIKEVVDNKTTFKTTNLINQGINLEKINEGTYLLLLKSKSEDKVTYYTLQNNSRYKDLKYYTITKDSQNKEINIGFKKLKDYSYLMLDCKKVKLPSDVYDVVIDPGHGGRDVGTNKNGKYESVINLDYAKSLKTSLENLGLKVKLTREDDVSIPNYGEGSRVNFAYETRAKLFLSIHQNSAIYNVGKGGVEIYIANHSSPVFANLLASNIVDLTSTIYSTNKYHRISDGVYMRTLSDSDIADMQAEALENGYEAYPLASTDSTYYFIIRETGGVASGAYVDSRNKEKPWNTYYNSNYGSESYLLELGYINSQTNLDILLSEKDKYVEAITKSCKEYLEI